MSPAPGAALFGGSRRAAADGETIAATNPATGEPLGNVARCREANVEVAVAAAQRAFPAWRRMHTLERAALIRALADAVEADRSRLLEIEMADNGSPREELNRDISIGVGFLRYFAGLVLQVHGETLLVADGRLNYTLREPFGVVARIIRFNHPLMFALARLAAPLLGGNTLIIKPSEFTSLSALALADHFEQIFPPGVVSIVTGLGDEAGDALVAHPGVPRIGVTGSLQTGLAIQRRAATSTIKTVTLELGGKSPLVVFGDADREAAMEAAVDGLRLNVQGQACGATTRLLVHRDLYEEFIAELGERLDAVRVGLPEDEASDARKTCRSSSPTRRSRTSTSRSRDDIHEGTLI